MKKYLKSDISKVVLIALIWILVVNLFSYWGSKIFKMEGISANRRFATVDHWFWYDSGFYLGIASNGYKTLHDPEVWGQNYVRAAFFPMYPLTGRLFYDALKFTNIDVRQSMLFVNYLFVIGISIFLYKLAYEYKKDKEYSYKTLIYFLVFPFSFFLLAPYSEASLVFFTVGAIYFMSKGNYLWAGLMGIGATASRFIGIIFPLIIFLHYLESNDWKIKSINIRIILYCIIPTLGLLGYMVYQKIYLGDYMYFYKMQKLWRSDFEINVFKTVWINYKEIFHRDFFNYRRINEIGSIIAFSVLGLISIKKTNIAFAVFIFLSLLVPLLTGRVDSINRFVVTIVPAFLIIGLIYKNRLLEWAYILICILFLAMFTLMFTHSMWVA